MGNLLKWKENAEIYLNGSNLTDQFVLILHLSLLLKIIYFQVLSTLYFRDKKKVIQDPEEILNQRPDGYFPPEPSREANTLSCFLLSNFTGVRRFFLLFTFLIREILKI